MPLCVRKLDTLTALKHLEVGYFSMNHRQRVFPDNRAPSQGHIGSRCRARIQHGAHQNMRPSGYTLVRLQPRHTITQPAENRVSGDPRTWRLQRNATRESSRQVEAPSSQGCPGSANLRNGCFLGDPARERFSRPIFVYRSVPNPDF